MALNWEKFDKLRRENPIPKFALDKAGKSLKKNPNDPYLLVLCAPTTRSSLLYCYFSITKEREKKYRQLTIADLEGFSSAANRWSRFRSTSHTTRHWTKVSDNGPPATFTGL